MSLLNNNTGRFKCEYSERCHSANTTKCDDCVHNTRRNFVEDFYEKADDNPIPDPNPEVSYHGPIEQSAGFKCPVCGKYSNPYITRNGICNSCGFRMNINPNQR